MNIIQDQVQGRSKSKAPILVVYTTIIVHIISVKTRQIIYLIIYCILSNFVDNYGYFISL